MLNQLEEIKDTLFKYFETRIDLFKIETRSKIEQAVVSAVYAALVLSIVLVIVILLVILLGTFLNKWLQSDYLGYVILLGVFIVKLVLWLVFKEKWMNMLRGLIIKFSQAKEDK